MLESWVTCIRHRVVSSPRDTPQPTTHRGVRKAQQEHARPDRRQRPPGVSAGQSTAPRHTMDTSKQRERVVAPEAVLRGGGHGLPRLSTLNATPGTMSNLVSPEELSQRITGLALPAARHKQGKTDTQCMCKTTREKGGVGNQIPEKPGACRLVI